MQSNLNAKGRSCPSPIERTGTGILVCLRHDTAKLVHMSAVGRDEWFSVGESPSIWGVPINLYSHRELHGMSECECSACAMGNLVIVPRIMATTYQYSESVSLPYDGTGQGAVPVPALYQHISPI